MRRLMTAGLIAAVLALSSATSVLAQAPGGAGAPTGPTDVGVVVAEFTEVPFIVTLPGRAAAFQSADIRPRVSGVIESIDYEPGRAVVAGEVLFSIEDDTFSATLASAKAAVAEAEAAVTASEAALQRADQLQGVGITRAGLETAQVTLANAQAALSSAQANEQLMQLDCDQTKVRSPIDGIPDLSQVTIGAIVTANQADALTTVRRIDPIYVDVAESSAAILRNRARIREGQLDRQNQLGAELTLEDGSHHTGTGTLISPGVSVSPTTGTRQMRFQFENADRRILPGQFLRVALTLGTTTGLLVPQRATSRAADGTLTVFVAQDGKAVNTTLTESGVYRNAWLVTEGLDEGAQIIVDGLENLRDGADVNTLPVTISADGVVEEVADTPTDTERPVDTTDSDAAQRSGTTVGQAAAATPATVN